MLIFKTFTVKSFFLTIFETCLQIRQHRDTGFAERISNRVRQSIRYGFLCYTGCRYGFLFYLHSSCKVTVFLILFDKIILPYSFSFAYLTFPIISFFSDIIIKYSDIVYFRFIFVQYESKKIFKVIRKLY